MRKSLPTREDGAVLIGKQWFSPEAHERKKARARAQAKKAPEYHADRIRRWRADNPAKKAEIYRRSRTSVEARARAMLRTSQTRARSKGWDFDLDLPWILDRLLRGRCEATGLELSLVEHPTAYRHPRSPSVDRLDSKGGYTKGNCQIVATIHYLSKGEWLVTDHLAYVEACARRYGLIPEQLEKE